MKTKQDGKDANREGEGVQLSSAPHHSSTSSSVSVVIGASKTNFLSSAFNWSIVAAIGDQFLILMTLPQYTVYSSGDSLSLSPFAKWTSACVPSSHSLLRHYLFSIFVFWVLVLSVWYRRRNVGYFFSILWKLFCIDSRPAVRWYIFIIRSNNFVAPAWLRLPFHKDGLGVSWDRHFYNFSLW